MEIDINDSTKTIDIWLTNAEKGDPKVKDWLHGVYAKYKPQKYLVAVFASGDRDLYDSTLDLLAYNRRRCAQIAVQRQKAEQEAAAEL